MAFFEKDFYLTIRDIDKNTDITNKAILAFFEDIGGCQSDMAGFGLKDIEKTKLSWVLLNWTFKVIKRIKYDGRMFKVRTWSRGIKRASCFRDYEIYNADNELCVVGTSKWTLIHLENGLMKLNEDILNKYVSDSKCVFGDNFDFKRLREPENSSLVYNYTVSRRDIDINNHMHNLYYLDLAYECLPKEVYENNTFNNVEIMYKFGSFLGDNLKCFYSNADDGHYIVIKSEDEKTLHSIIKLY